MSRDALKTLFYPFDSGVIDPPGEGERVLFLGAEAGYRLPQGFEASIAAVQPLRPLYRALEAVRADVSPEITGEDYDVTLVLCGKHKGENEDRIAEALKHTREGGLIVVAMLGAVLVAGGDAQLKPFATALVAMAVIAALAGAAPFFGLSGKWRRQREPESLATS